MVIIFKFNIKGDILEISFLFSVYPLVDSSKEKGTAMRI